MFTKLIIKIGIPVLLISLGLFFNPYAVVKKTTLKEFKIRAYNDSVSVAKLESENVMQDSLLYSLQQDIDIIKANDVKFQIIIKALRNENNKLKENETICCDDLHTAENTGGIIRDTVYLNWRGKVKTKK